MSSKMSMQVGWDEGNETDFSDLHAAIKNGTASSEFEATESSTPPRSDITEDSSSDEDDTEPLEDPQAHFLWAAQYNRKDLILSYLAKDPSLLRFADKDGYTALHRAAYSNNKDICLELLLAGGPDLLSSAMTNDGWTPLHSAARWNAFECVELLLSFGADVNRQSEGGQTPLHLAAANEASRETLQLLLLNPYIDGTIKNCQGDTPRDIAVRNNNCVKLFDLVEPGVRKVSF